jgi:hypothetical protein
MSLKLTEKKKNNFLVLDVSIDDDSSLNIELGVFAKNMKEVIRVIDSSLSFLMRYDGKKLLIC